MAWYDEAVFYHIYPLGLCGCAHENTGVSESHFPQLREWAKHAADINCTAIYIGPLFESVGHGYETTDYCKVDCRLGTNEDFKQFVSYCHEIGLRVIVDGVFNHVGREFFAFKDVKEKRENSPYCSWFCNLNFHANNEYNDGFSYDNWGGYNLLVKLNQQNPEVQNHIFDAIRFWVSEFDIDGIRLDAADVLDHGFMHNMRQVTDTLKPDFWLMGEVIHGDYSRWVNHSMLHAVTNYELHKGLYSGHNDHNYFEIAHSIKRLLGICGDFRLYTFTDNHDVERIYSKLTNKEHLYLVTILNYTVYGIPSLYYGSEFAIEGRKENGSDWNLRPYLALKDYADATETNEITKLCKQLGQMKKDYPQLSYGSYQELTLTNRQFSYARVLDQAAIIVALNNDDQEAVIELNSPVSANKASDLLGQAKSMSYENGHLKVVLPANRGTVIYLGDEVKELQETSTVASVSATEEAVPVSHNESVTKQAPEDSASFNDSQAPEVSQSVESSDSLEISQPKEYVPKVLLLNGSVHKDGSTATALFEVEKVLREQGVETEVIQVGHLVPSCGAFCSNLPEHPANEYEQTLVDVAAKFEQADGLVVGSPVYYAAANPVLTSFLTSLFYGTKFDKTMKVGAAVASARRGGLTATFDELNKFFTISGMPVASSQYWNGIHGNNAQEAKQDAEGLQIMRTLGRNMAFLLKSIALGKERYGLPQKEDKIGTNFIR